MSILTAEGFQRKTYIEYVAQMQQQARELWGEDVDLSDYSPHGQWIKMLAYERMEADDLAEAVFNSAYVDTAEGIQLDFAVKYKGIERFAEKAAVGQVVLTVDPGTTVAAGLWVGTTNGVNFYTTESANDATNAGVITVGIAAVIPGNAGNVPANTITEIVTPTAGVKAANNPQKTDLGRDRETDGELRNRYYATSGEGSTVDGINSTILNTVPGVRAAIVVENDGPTSDSDGRPPHSFEAIVLGGVKEDIAAAILKKKPGGIRAFGSTTVTVKDAAGNDQQIGFSYANPKNIFVEVDVVKDSTFPDNGRDMIELEILKYIGGIDRNDNVYAGLGMGKSVIVGKLASNIFMNVPGVTDAIVSLSLDGTGYAQNSISIAKVEVAQTSIDKLVINVG